MPFYYDAARLNETSNASAGTTSTHMYAKPIANQETCSIKAMYANARTITTAGGAQLRCMTNAGSSASGGTSQTPAPRNPRNPAANTTWFNDATAITPGGTLTLRQSCGFAQTGGQGGWNALEPSDAIQLIASGIAGALVDAEFVSIATASSVVFDLTVEFSEGA